MNSKLITALVIIVIIAGGYFFLTMPDNRTVNEKLGDAVHDINKGPAAASRQLENRTPGEKVGDAVKDAGDNVKDATSSDHHP